MGKIALHSQGHVTQGELCEIVIDKKVENYLASLKRLANHVSEIYSITKDGPLCFNTESWYRGLHG